MKIEKSNKNKMIKGAYFRVYFQILLMIGMTFSFAYFIHESSGYVEDSRKVKNSLLEFLKIFNKIIFNEKNLVSALSSDELKNDLTSGLSGSVNISDTKFSAEIATTESQNRMFTCPIDLNNSICQEYPSDICRSKCQVNCLPMKREQSASCKLGICYNVQSGICTDNAPKVKCEADAGQWFDNALGNIQQCKKGCCILGENAKFTTAQECKNSISVLGINGTFKPEINLELTCVVLSKTQEEGACVFESELQNTCKFTTKLNCLQNMKGKFYSNLLCSNPSLKTNCIAQQSLNCAKNEDEIYWFDSCGNRENIYEGSSSIERKNSLNNFIVLPRNESCSIFSGTNFIANRATCGNCNRLIGSVCGLATDEEKLSNIEAKVVCRDLSCKDSSGQKRENGESWCEYQGTIGTEKGSGGFLRGADTVGSRNFRKVCIDGDIRTEPCADYRNEICVESQTELFTKKKFSSAACRINNAYKCYEYNQEGDEMRKQKCEQNPDCFIKHVEVNSKFKFDFCVPRYKPGFNLEERGVGASKICSLATQTCKYVKVCSAFSCKEYNEECLTSKFTEQMNDICISLGDCGAQVNYQGKLVENYRILRNEKKTNAQKLTIAYINGLKEYTKIIKGKIADPGNYSTLYGDTGIPGTLGAAELDKPEGMIKQMGMITGAAGLVMQVAARYAPNTLGGFFGGVGSELVVNTAGQPAGSMLYSSTKGVVSTATQGMKPALVAAGNSVAVVLSLAAIAFTIYGFAKQGDWGAVALLTGAAIGAFIIAGGIGAFSAGNTMAVIAALAGPLFIAGLVVAIIAMILSLLGSKKEIDVKFQCLPWQAPLGGEDCAKCGSDGKPCSRYACSSLGQSCQIINEEAGLPQCISVSLNDSSAPVITPLTNILSDGYIGEQNENGIKIKTSTGEGCITETYKTIPFGISLNENGACVIESNHTESIEEMSNVLSLGLFLKNHSLPIAVPGLDSFGLESFNPNAREDINIYLRCVDKAGNANIKEYVVNFCIKPGNDTTPAVIIEREPSNEKVKFDASEVKASVYTNEPADCRYDVQDKEYSLMKNQMLCMNNFNDRDWMRGGWQCNATLPFSSELKEMTYYMRCLDKPYLNGTGAEKRSPNTQSYEFKIIRSPSALKIDYTSLENKELVFVSEPAQAILVVRTSGGADNGIADCHYNVEGSSDRFFDTFNYEHKQIFDALKSGSYEIDINCTDEVGNNANKKIGFSIKLDTQAPIVTRVYQYSGELNVVSDEKSTCYYALNPVDECLFDIRNATQMSGLDTLKHSTEINYGSTYYIKCKDALGNYPGECSIIVKGVK